MRGTAPRTTRPVLALAALVLLAGCGSDPAAAPAPTVTITETTAAAPAAPPTTTEPPAATAPRATKSQTSKTAAGYEMPDVVGISLQEAQNKIQSAAGGFFYSKSHDVSGQGRIQVLDAGWQVCDQSLKAGKTFTDDTDIDLGVVRVSEDCP